MIQANNLTKSYGLQVLFEDATITLGKGERVGLVGRNGAGKSTLMKILLGTEGYDGGTITMPQRYRIATLEQHLRFTHPTILSEAASALPKEQEFDHFRAEKILMGLGFKISDFDRAPSEFSGGMQIRLNLAKVLLQDPDCLFLDEPTNYLDIVGLRWLAGFLRQFRGELVLVTHDRGFMDQVTTHTMGIWRKRVVKVPGPTTKFYAKLAEEEEIHERTRQNQEKKRRELEEFVDRFGAKASKAAQAQSRVKQLEKLPELEELAAVETLDFSFTHQECPGKVLMELSDLSFAWPGGGPLFRNLSLYIERQDKIAVVGKNGRGKSTLLNVLAGELESPTGSRRHHPSLLIGHFGQTNIQRLSMNATVEEEIQSANPALPIQRVRSICGVMMFGGDLAKKKISVLSGGERSRVLLGKLLARPTNLLLLDEPSNHLDQESVQALLEELKSYAGAVVVVTHSEEFVRQLAQKLVVFRDEGEAEVFIGGYEEFLAKGGWGDDVPAPSKAETAPLKRDRNELKRLRAELVQERSRKLNPLKKQLTIYETSIDHAEKRAAEIENHLIEGGGDVAALSKELGVLRKEIDKLFDEFAALGEEHDRLVQDYERRLSELAEA